MTEVEALLSVDAGKVPPGASAFRARDPETATRTIRACLALVFAMAAVGCALVGVGREALALLVLTASIFAVLATPDEKDPELARHKKPTLVVTPTGMIVRDAHGLRTWLFEDVVDVSRVLADGTSGLLITRRNGRSDFVDTEAFELGERLWPILRGSVPAVRSPGAATAPTSR